jgi:hypothetical protein
MSHINKFGEITDDGIDAILLSRGSNAPRWCIADVKGRKHLNETTENRKLSDLLTEFRLWPA